MEEIEWTKIQYCFAEYVASLLIAVREQGRQCFPVKPLQWFKRCNLERWGALSQTDVTPCNSDKLPKKMREICTAQDVLSTLRDWVSNVPDNCGYLIVGVSFYLNFFIRSIHICLYTQQLFWPTRSPLWISPTELSGISVSCKIYVIFFSPENCSLSFSHLDLIGKTLKDIKCAGKAYFREDLYRHFH